MTTAPKLVSTIEITIDKGIPLPGTGRHDSILKRYPLDGMEVGDSFLVPGATSTARVRNSLLYHVQKRKWRVALRTDVTGKGIRVWRTA